MFAATRSCVGVAKQNIRSFVSTFSASRPDLLIERVILSDEALEILWRASAWLDLVGELRANTMSLLWPKNHGVPQDWEAQEVLFDGYDG